MASETPQPPATPGDQPQQQTRQVEIVLDDREAHAAYANLAAVRQTTEEVIMDFALNINPPNPQGQQNLRVSQRLIVNYYTAKRLCIALQGAIIRHEQTFGVIELDPEKRKQQQAAPVTGAAPIPEAKPPADK